MRMAVHTGTADERNGDYFGPPQSRRASISGRATAARCSSRVPRSELCAAICPMGAQPRDLGSHRLKDLSAPEHVWQLDVAGLPNEFPRAALARCLAQ